MAVLLVGVCFMVVVSNGTYVLPHLLWAGVIDELVLFFRPDKFLNVCSGVSCPKQPFDFTVHSWFLIKEHSDPNSDVHTVVNVGQYRLS